MSKIINRSEVHISNMKDGDIAVVMRWHDAHLKQGDLIQRFRNTIMPIGKSSDYSYSTLLEVCKDLNITVLILRPGTKVIIEI